jgi:hypothetical protein
MPIVFARVELRGEPSKATYDKLHAHMKTKNWEQFLPGYPAKQMPHAMYQGSYPTKPNLASVVDSLKKSIEAEIWTQAIVLAIEEVTWAQSAG